MDLLSSGHFTNMSVNAGMEPVTKVTKVHRILSTFVAEKNLLLLRSDIYQLINKSVFYFSFLLNLLW